MRRKGSERRKLWGRVKRWAREVRADWDRVARLEAFSMMALGK